jgi:hypothetical protein
MGKPFIVEAKLSKRPRHEELKVIIEEPGKREIASLKVSDRMSAMLSGGRIRTGIDLAGLGIFPNTPLCVSVYVRSVSGKTQDVD